MESLCRKGRSRPVGRCRACGGGMWRLCNGFAPACDRVALPDLRGRGEGKHQCLKDPKARNAMPMWHLRFLPYIANAVAAVSGNSGRGDSEVSSFAVTFKTAGHQNTFSVLDSYAETAAPSKGGHSFKSERGTDFATWIFGSPEARDHFVTLAWMNEHLRLVTARNSNSGTTGRR